MNKLPTILIAFLLLIALPLGVAADNPETKRRKIDSRTEKALEKVLGDSKNARSLYDDAAGYAVFTTTKAAFGVSGGAGSGVAIHKDSGDRTYMKMGTAGIGFGIGVKRYEVVMLFETEQAFRSFVDKGWRGDAQAGAAAGTEGVSAQTTFHDGMAIFVRTKKGLMASADVSGTKYWRSDLNG